MGLDNGFILRDRRDPDFKVELCWFRNFYELDRFFSSCAEKISEDQMAVSHDDILDFYSLLFPACNAIHHIGLGAMLHYEDVGEFPAPVLNLFYGLDFNPAETNTSYLCQKVVTAHSRIGAMLEIIDNNDNPNYYIEFVSSY